jgi:hypothetical protein
VTRSDQDDVEGLTPVDIPSQGSQLWGGWYSSTLAVALVTASLLSLALQAFGRSDARVTAQSLLTPFGVALTVLGVLVYVLAAVGPAYASPSRRRWLFASPLDRSVLLRDTLRGSRTSSAFVGALTGVAVLIAVVSGSVSLPGTMVAIVCGTAAGLAFHEVVLGLQSVWRGKPSPRRALLRTGAFSALVGSIMTTADLRNAAPSSMAAQMAMGPPSLVVAVAAVAGLAALVVISGSVLSTSRRTRALPMAALAPGGDLVESLTGATMMMDTAAVEVHSEQQRIQRRPRYRSHRARGPAATDLIIGDVLAVGRRRREVVPRFLSAVLAWEFGTLFGNGVWLAVATMVTYVTAAHAGAKLRTWLGSPGLRRSFPQGYRSVTLRLCVVPALVALLTASFALWGGTGPAVLPVVVALAVLAGLVRRGRRGPMQVGVFLSTPAGSVPVGVVQHLIHGPDATALCLAAALAAGPYAGLLLAVGILARELLSGLSDPGRTFPS